MTLIISMCTEKGIHMIADSLVIDENEHGQRKAMFNIEKIKVLKESKTAFSFWGTVENDQTGFSLSNELEKLNPQLENFKQFYEVTPELARHFEKIKLLDADDRLGFHVATFMHGVPELHHVFHETFLQRNQFLNEDSTKETHIGLTKTLGFKKISINLPYPMLFNGDNRVPNLFMNNLQWLESSIEYHKLNETEAGYFLKFLMDTAINLQTFSKEYRELGKLIDYPLMYCKLTKEGVVDPIFIKKESNGQFSEHKTLEDAGGKIKR